MVLSEYIFIIESIYSVLKGDDHLLRLIFILQIKILNERVDEKYSLEMSMQRRQ
jgi:hypothetical protein